MTREEWEAAYPCRVVTKRPRSWDENSVYDSRDEAESFKDWVESCYGTGGIEILVFDGKWYVCYEGDDE